MKIIFVSNYFNHHQKPFCEEMYRRLGTDFSFISTGVMRDERKKLGYEQNDIPAYVFSAIEDELKRKAAVDMINMADIVIAGAAPEELLCERIRSGKLVLRYSERPFKRKTSVFRRMYHSIRFHRRDMGNKRVYMLCASAYTAKDFASVGMYKKRTYKWGYFPEIKEYDTQTLLDNKKRNTLMWCGRFLDWKHPDDAVRLAQRLKADGYDFQLNFVGTGTMEAELHNLVESLDLTDCVSFLGSMSPEQVRTHMERAGIYLFTSDRQEGWGAVLNESMNSGCAVVASHAIGSVPFLIKDGENGYIYPSGNVDILFDKVKYLLDHPEEQKNVGLKAYDTVISQWNAEVAADRLLHLTEKLLSGDKHPQLFEEGPCSFA